MANFCGVDVSMRSLDASAGARYSRFSNDLVGFEAFRSFFPSGIVCMEATGVYFRPFALYLARHGYTVYVVNPVQVRRFAESRLAKNKTDRVDARLIQEFVRRMRDDLVPWDTLPDSLYLMSLLVRFAEGLVTHRIGVSNRLHALAFAYPDILPRLDGITAFLHGERERMLDLAYQVLATDALLRRWHDALLRLPGFGGVTTLRFMAHAQDLRRFPSVRHFGSYTGLSPELRQSGNLNAYARISRQGPAGLRHVLYTCAVACTRTSTPQAAYYQRLRAQGKPAKVALVALAHKLGRCAWTVCVKRPTS
jgi:transposase